MSSVPRYAYAVIDDRHLSSHRVVRRDTVSAMGKPLLQVGKPKSPAPKIKITFTPQQLALFREFGAQGGATRAKKLTAKERSASASKASRARWAKVGKAGAARRKAE